MKILKGVFLFLCCCATTYGDDIAFFYALDADFANLKASGTEAGQPLSVGKRRIQRIQLGNHNVYAVKMGSGCVETALSAQALLSRIQPSLAISIGPAGTLTDELKIGTWVRVEAWIPWQKNFAKFIPSPLPQQSEPAIWRQTIEVRLASGEAFINSAAQRDRLRNQTQAKIVDMNQFGLAQACEEHNVPLIVWKIISDHANENATADFRKFVEKYQGEGGKAVAELINALPANPNDPNSYPALKKLLDEK